MVSLVASSVEATQERKSPLANRDGIHIFFLPRVNFHAIVPDHVCEQEKVMRFAAYHCAQVAPLRGL